MDHFSSSSHIIVIGSGIASITAAYQLAQKGTKIIVLQANDYIGGRLKTKNVILSNHSNFAFDYGASWIHGSCSKHPITQLSRKINGVKMFQTDDDNIVNYDLQGNQVDKQVQKQFNIYEKMTQKMDDYQNMSIYQAFKKINPDKLHNKFFMYNVSNDIQFQTSAPLHDLSAEYGQDDSNFDGDQMIICSGYQKFAEHLSNHQNIKVLLNHSVRQIIYKEQKSIVKCQNGQVFQGKIVIVGVPLGVLKTNNIRFVPELPHWKQQAIQKIHFGNVCKVLIVLKDKKIKHKQHYIGVIQDDVDKRGLATYFLNISSIASLPALMTFGLGGNSDELQMMSQQALKKLIASRLSVFADQQFTTNDFEIVRTNWRKDLNFRGTYSYSAVQTKPIHWKNMAKPVFSSNLYFCGEHTNSKYRGTVHGAYLSGKYVAQAILGNVTQKNWKFKAASNQNESQGEQQNKNNKKRKQKRRPNKQQSSSSEEQQKNRHKNKKKQESSSSSSQSQK